MASVSRWSWRLTARRQPARGPSGQAPPGLGRLDAVCLLIGARSWSSTPSAPWPGAWPIGDLADRRVSCGRGRPRTGDLGHHGGARRIRRWPRPLVVMSRVPGQERAMAALSDQLVSASWRSWTHSSGGVATWWAMAGTSKTDREMPTRRSILATMRVRTFAEAEAAGEGPGVGQRVGHGGDERQAAGGQAGAHGVGGGRGPERVGDHRVGRAVGGHRRGQGVGELEDGAAAGPFGTGVRSPWLGASKATTRKPAATSGRRRRPAPAPPPQPWTR